MLPGLVEGITDAYKKWFPGTKSDKNEKEEKPSHTPLSPEELPTVTKVPQNLKKTDSLTEALFLLRLEALAHSTDKMNVLFAESKQIYAKHRTLNELMERITQKTEDGKLKVDDDLKALLQEAKNQGIEISLDKKSYDKDQLNKLISSIDNKVGQHQQDMRLKQTEIEECQKNQYQTLQILMTIIKKHENVWAQIKNGIASR